MKYYLKRIVIIPIITTIGALLFFLFYANSLSGIDAKTLAYYEHLHAKLEEKGYKPNTVVISGKRALWHNKLLSHFGAAKNSQHLSGNAIDIMVLDVNDDGSIDGVDVDIVSVILRLKIGNNGGIGTYKSEGFIWNRQMVHFDSRGYKARWNR